MISYDPTVLPENLPVPENDGAADHLAGSRLPDIALPSTLGGVVNIAEVGVPRAVIFAYPRTGRPNELMPDGWDAIPGARGCTPQTCSFRDLHQEFTALGTEVYGISTQSSDYQREMVERLHVLFPVLSDAQLELARALRLPTFAVEGMALLKRLTLVISDGVIEHVFYPVFPPNRSADAALEWLRQNPLSERTA